MDSWSAITVICVFECGFLVVPRLVAALYAALAAVAFNFAIAYQHSVAGLDTKL